MTKKPKEIDLNAFEQPEEKPTPNLPPAGFERNEELLRRIDALEQKAEAQYADRGAVPHDHDALNPERNREIQHDIHRGHMAIGFNHPIYVTKWVNYVNHNSFMVWQAKDEGWKVATVDIFPEAADSGCIRADNTIRVGDVLLMYIRKDDHFMLLERDKKKRLRQQYGIEVEIHDIARKHPSVFNSIGSTEDGGIDDRTLNVMERRASRQSAARQVAARHLGNKMKQGIVPGIPLK